MSGLVLTTARLDLLPWAADHAALLGTLASLPEVVRHIGDGRPWPPRRVQEFARVQERRWEGLGFGWRLAQERATGRRVGFIGLQPVGEGTAGLAADETEIGWWLHPAAWGRGFAREGAAAVLDEAFDRVGAVSVVARIQPANRASVRVAEALGLRFERSTEGRFGEPLSVHRAQR